MSTVGYPLSEVLRACAKKIGAMETVRAIDEAYHGRQPMLDIPSVAHELLRDFPKCPRYIRSHLEALSRR